MTTIKRPMLAASATEEEIKAVLADKGELWISPKIDGVRGLVLDGKLYSRSMKPIPNESLNRMIGYSLKENLDGELTVGRPAAPDVFQATSGTLRRATGEVSANYWVFDDPSRPDDPYYSRWERLDFSRLTVGGLGAPNLGISRLEFFHARTWDDVRHAEEHIVGKVGYEGLILRDPMAPYKQGRSTVKEAGMLKLKRFVDAEATVVGLQELLHNENPAMVSEIGRTKRSSHKENKVAGGKLGALLVRHLETGAEFAIGTGFSDAQRREIWENGDRVIGKVVKFKSFPVGVKDAPRHPTFLGFREPWDMDQMG